MGERSTQLQTLQDQLQKLEDGRRNLILLAASGWVAAAIAFILGVIK